MPLRRAALLVLALLAGGATAVVVPALGTVTGHAVTASDTSGHQWSPATITIAAGDTVTWSYPSGTSIHNVHFTDGGAFADQPSSPSAPGWTAQRTFDTDNTTYHYQCALHSSMKGVIVVGTGGVTTTMANTTPTTTNTTPTTTTTNTTPTTPTGTTPTTPVTTPPTPRRPRRR